ncbi:MAG: tRNA (adenosine(37)-N6)-dimethylallyltransferase MiaA, partial [Nitrospirota bacterium]
MNGGGITAIVGPTASGKSTVAVHLAREWGAEIICADSRQVYRGFDLLTDKPTAEDRRIVPHHLLDVIGPEETFTAGEFRRRALAVLEDLGRRRVPSLIVGGTGLYVRALRRGLADLPAGDPALRRELFDRERVEGAGTLHRILSEVDPAAADRISSANLHRIVRALEVHRLTGRPLSEWHAGDPAGGVDMEIVGLFRERGDLERRIEARIDRMVEEGLADEVRRALAPGLRHDLPALSALGVRPIIDAMRGRRPLESAISQMKKETRAYAKRQMTWFRREPDVVWADVTGLSDPEAMAARVKKVL